MMPYSTSNSTISSGSSSTSSSNGSSSSDEAITMDLINHSITNSNIWRGQFIGSTFIQVNMVNSVFFKKSSKRFLSEKTNIEFILGEYI